MKYNQPYGLSDETTLYSVPYINGNPSTGTMGSIPPAASIEHDQREIVAVIQWAYDHGYLDYAGQLCQAPTGADLTQLLKAIYGISNSRLLQAPRDYYVNYATGNDLNDGLSADKPFKNIQTAQNTLSRFNLNGFNVTVHVAPGTYAPLWLGSIGGSGTVSYIGSPGTPSQTVLVAQTGPAITASGSGAYNIDGFKLQSNAISPGVPSCGVWVWGTATVQLFAVDFGPAVSAHMIAVNGGYIGCFGPFTVSGTSSNHMNISTGGRILCQQTSLPGFPVPTLNITAAVNVSDWLVMNGGATSIRYSSIIGAGNVTGRKYNINLNGFAETGGAGVNFLPGNAAGITATGGQYI